MKYFQQIQHIVLFVLMAIFAVSLTPMVEATSPNYDILSVEVNDLTLFSSDPNASTISTLDVQRKETLVIEVVIEGDANITGGLADDVFIEARISGYEFGRIADIVGPFSVEAGKTYKKILTINVPFDIDASEIYTLRVEVSDSLDEEQVDIDLHVDEERHGLNIFDILLNPASTITANNPLFVTVRLENLGEKKEEDIKVKVSIPELGVSAVNFIDELVTQIQEEQEQFRDDEESSRQIDMLLRIPHDAPTGTYDVRVDVDYNRGHSFLSESLSVNVQGREEQEQVQTIINSDSTSKASAAGEDVTYRIMIANLGSEPGIYSVQVDGVAPWGEVRVDPGFSTVMPDSTGEVAVTLTPFAVEKDESHTWVARVLLGTQVVQELTFTTKVTAPEMVVVPATNRGDTVKTVLAVIFGLLVIILIVLALIIAFRKMAPSDDQEGTPTAAVEGQTYYYHPNK